MNDNQPKMFDSKLILAIGIMVLMWFGYESYLRKKYPDAYKNTAAATAPTQSESVEPATMGSAQAAKTADAAAVKAAGPAEEQFLEVEDQNWKIRFSSKGFAIEQLTLKGYTDRENKQIEFVGGTEVKNFETNLVGRKAPIDFTLSRTSENQVVGVATVGATKIRKAFVLDSTTYSINAQVNVEGADENFSGLVTKVVATVHPKTGGSFLAPSIDHQEFFVNHDGSESRLVLADGKGQKETYSKVSVAALASQYFAMGIVDSSDSVPEFQAGSATHNISGGTMTEAVGTLTHHALSRGAEFNTKYKIYAGPKSWKLLESADKSLPSMINFGFFKTIAVWIFRLLLAIHATIGNWGLAIILLTILVRMVVLPFNMMSYRSMKAMTKIQPQIKSIRDKYKEDPVKQNQEIMKIMKESKANPLGGCLPIFLQIPVFFALYQVLGQSIELYKAPFFLWITDLSGPDKFYVFPALMGVTMFIQQKITPSTLEPAQQKILLIMPVFLTVLMAGLPSGLTLYMFVSTLFGVSQQLYFMKDDKKREAKA